MSKAAIAAIGFGHSARAYAGTAAPRPVLVNHVFELTRGGELAHYMDGNLVALVPPEGMRDYAELWPDCAPLVKDQMAPAPAAARSVRRAPPARRRTA